MVEGRPDASSKVDGQVDGTSAGPDLHLRAPIKTSASLLTPRVPFDNTKHTVIVMDDYRNPDQLKLGEKTFSHGELIARINEENGFNAVRMQTGTLKTVLSLRNFNDFGNSIMPTAGRYPSNPVM
ncbi:MAG: hypothetical protein U0105_13260 [Candidatus Obscuribacterales bacterium]